MRTPVDILKAGVEQMTPETWMQGSYAPNDEGVGCDSNDPKACRWCSIGWIVKLVGPIPMPCLTITSEAEQLYHETREMFHGPLLEMDEENCGLVDFNDSHTFEEVKALWQKTLKAAEKKYGTVRES